MTFVTGLILIDAPASALNNSDQSIPGARTDNSSDVKYIHTKQGDYPYVSAQAFRAWLRNSIKHLGYDNVSPIYRDDKVAYTAGNPITYWDDDLFGYMRAPGEATRRSRIADPAYNSLTALDTDPKGKEQTVTRASPFRVSTLVSLAPVYLTTDFGTMSRQTQGTAINPNADPVPYEHRFYKATLQGLLSLDLSSVGYFTYHKKTGYQNLDEVRKQLAVQQGLIHLEDEKAYVLAHDERLQRSKALFEGIANLRGGAKLSTHYTDVSPSVVILAVTRGGNHIFRHVFSSDARWSPTFNVDAFLETLTVYSSELLSPVYVGWEQGFLQDERGKIERLIEKLKEDTKSEDGSAAGSMYKAVKVELGHPKIVLEDFVKHLELHQDWME